MSQVITLQPNELTRKNATAILSSIRNAISKEREIAKPILTFKTKDNLVTMVIETRKKSWPSILNKQLGLLETLEDYELCAQFRDLIKELTD